MARHTNRLVYSVTFALVACSTDASPIVDGGQDGPTDTSQTYDSATDEMEAGTDASDSPDSGSNHHGSQMETVTSIAHADRGFGACVVTNGEVECWNVGALSAVIPPRGPYSRNAWIDVFQDGYDVGAACVLDANRLNCWRTPDWDETIEPPFDWAHAQTNVIGMTVGPQVCVLRADGRVLCSSGDPDYDFNELGGSLHDVDDLFGDGALHNCVRRGRLVSCWGTRIRDDRVVEVGHDDFLEAEFSFEPALTSGHRSSRDDLCAVSSDHRWIECLELYYAPNWEPIFVRRSFPVQRGTDERVTRVRGRCYETSSGSLRCARGRDGEWSYYEQDGGTRDFEDPVTPFDFHFPVHVKSAPTEGAFNCHDDRHADRPSGRTIFHWYACQTSLDLPPWSHLTVSDGWFCGKGNDGSHRCSGTSFTEMHDPGVSSFEAMAADVGDFRVYTNEATTCVLSAGRVQCSGRDERHEAPADLPEVRELVVDLQTVCAVTIDHEVWCWGDHGTQTLLTATEEHRAVSKVSIDEDRVCALLEGGATRCWGGGMPESLPVDEPRDVLLAHGYWFAIDASGRVVYGPGAHGTREGWWPTDLFSIENATRLGHISGSSRNAAGLELLGIALCVAGGSRVECLDPYARETRTHTLEFEVVSLHSGGGQLMCALSGGGEMACIESRFRTDEVGGAR